MVDELKVWELEKMLKPIAEAFPVGQDPREDSSLDSLYRQLKDARSEARRIERKQWLEGMSISSKSMAHWCQVFNGAVVMIELYSKDLEVLAWLAEAALRLQGFFGLSRIFHLITALVERYETQLFPSVKAEEGLEWKVQALAGLNGEEVDGSLIMPIRNVSFTEHAIYPLWQYQQEPDEKMEQAIKSSSSEFVDAFRRNLEYVIDAYQNMTKCLDEVFGEHSPPSSRILACLEGYQYQFEQIYKAKQESTQQLSELLSQPMEIEPESESDFGNNAKTTRSQMLRQVRHIADYFSQAEPHSPLSYMLYRVVEWSSLSLPELLPKLVKDEVALEQIYKISGIHY